MALLYHEKQIGALCGQHALNNLLQGPYVTVDLLMDIARELQERERNLMLSQGTDTPDALQYLAQDSQYIDDSGNFSVEVLREALRRSHALELVLATSPSVLARLDDPTGEEAFLFNLHSHWFAIRRVEGEYWDLNSLSKRPTRVGNFHLAATLAQLRAEGWSIFLIDGALPRPLQDPSVGSPSSWVRTTDLPTGGGDRSSGRQREDDDIQAAIAASLQGASAAPPASAASAYGGDEQGGGEDDELARAISLSLQGGGSS